MIVLRPATACGLVLVVATAGCGPSDPQERLLTERARWNVTLTDWAQGDDGTVTLSTRVSGPVNSELPGLTVRLVFQDAAGETLGHRWETFDLSAVRRGGPEDFLLRFDPGWPGVEGIGVDLVPVPGPDELPHIPELRP